MATIPTGGYEKVTVGRRRSQGYTESPFSQTRKVYDWAATKWTLELTTRRFKEGDAALAAWIAFFTAANGMQNTFTFNLSRYVPGVSGLTSVVFRLDDSAESWETDRQRTARFSLAATSV